jgi:hypothetical protein
MRIRFLLIPALVMSTITCGDQTVPVALVTATHTLLTDSPFPS